VADFGEHAEAIERAGYALAGVSTDSHEASAVLRADLFLPFELLRDSDRSMLASWDLLDTSERDGVPVPAVFAIGRGRRVLGRSIDSMTRQVHPLEFLAALEQPEPAEPRRHLVIPRMLRYLRLMKRVARGTA